MAIERLETAVAQVLLRELGAPPALVQNGCLFSRDGLDSFDRVRLVELLEERFDVRIAWPHVVPENFDTVASIARLLAAVGVQACEIRSDQPASATPSPPLATDAG